MLEALTGLDVSFALASNLKRQAPTAATSYLGIQNIRIEGGNVLSGANGWASLPTYRQH